MAFSQSTFFPLDHYAGLSQHLVNLQSLTKVLLLIHFVETTANNLTFNKSIGFRNGSNES